MIFIFSFSISLLVLWEFYEFAVDTLTFAISNKPTNMQRYTWVNTNSFFPQDYGLLDTMLDLILGALGAAIVCFFSFTILRKEENKNQEIANNQEIS